MSAVDRVEQALTLLLHSARVSPPLREAVRLVEDDKRRLTSENERLRSVLTEARECWEQMKRPAHKDSAVPYLRLDRLLRSDGSAP